MQVQFSLLKRISLAINSFRGYNANMWLKLKQTKGYLFFTKRKKIIIPALIILLLLFFIFRPKNPPPVETAAVKKGDLVISVSGTGTVQSLTSVNLNFLSGGKLVYLGVKQGDTVAPYQTIGVLDERSIEKNLQIALRDYAKQRNTFEQTKANNNNTTPQTAANDQVRRILENNQFDLEKAVISVELQDLAKQSSVLTTPIGGIVTRADVSSAGVNVSPTTTFTIADPDNLVFNIDVDEADIGKVSLTNFVKVTLDAYPQENITIPITNIDFASHTTTTGGNAYTVEATLPPNSSGKYRIGMNGNAEIILNEKKNILTVPLSAIFQENYLFVKKSQKFEKRKVILGIKNDTDVEVKTGLLPGEIIAVQPEQINSSPSTWIQQKQ